jgi:hypothetical protein
MLAYKQTLRNYHHKRPCLKNDVPWKAEDLEYMGVARGHEVDKYILIKSTRDHVLKMMCHGSRGSRVFKSCRRA